MPTLPDKDVTVNVPSNIDYSMFDDAEVGNIILQRSEVGSVKTEINNWIAGDDTGLLKYANKHKKHIMQEAMSVACRELGFFLKAADQVNPSRIADIGCGYALADLILYRRYKCDIILIDIEESSNRHFGFQSSGAGYASLAKAREFLMKNGVPKDKIHLVNPNKQDVAKIGKIDLAISLASCGFHYPVETYDTLFENQISSGGGVILDIRKGSGGIKTMKSFGDVTVLKKHPKYSTVYSKVQTVETPPKSKTKK